ncbi:hypothetical protein SDC9_103784 [bioreactor metagenome]|uniref:HEAT repeat domain-containing protein n=1 Tax=bioreactor metagenome TaxID=1076179 RepID=A0A645AV23_9ZZZZ
MSLTVESIMEIPKENLSPFSAALGPEDVAQLVSWLSRKEDDIRYRTFLLLQEKSRLDNSVYPYFQAFCEKLGSENSYQRSLGVMLIAENVQWDTESKMREVLPAYLKILYDEKPITVRQCVGSLGIIVKAAPAYGEKISRALLMYDVMSVRETMRKLILLDIVTVLAEIRKVYSDPKIDAYLLSALSGEILDSKAKKALQKLL